MNEVSMASSALSMIQGNTQTQIQMSIIKKNAEAEQALANMLMENAKVASQISSKTGGIDIYI